MLRSPLLRTIALVLGGLLLVPACSKKEEEEGAGRPFLYVGGELNITTYAFNPEDGSLEKVQTLQPRPDAPLTAAFMVASKDHKFLYVLERTNGKIVGFNNDVNEETRLLEAKMPLEGFVVTYSISQSTGKLKELARVEAGGGRPTYITLDQTGKFLLVANNLGHVDGQGNSLAVFKIKADGTVNEAHQTLMSGYDAADKPFIRSHQIRIHPSNKYVYVPNIDSDTVSQFLFDEKKGMLTPNEPAFVKLDGGEDNAPQGGPMGIMFGPRHLDFHPNGKVYLSNEYSAVVVVFTVNDDGTLEQMPAMARGVPEDFDGVKWQAEIRVHPSGNFIYVGERDKRQAFKDPAVDAMGTRQDSMAIFAVNAKTGALTLKKNVPTNKTPRNHVLDPSGNWLIVGNQEADSLMTFKIGAKDGMLEMVDEIKEQRAPYVHLFVNLP